MDELFMKKAIELAKLSTCDVPVGAVIVHDGKIIAVGYNMKEITKDPTHHAEIIAIKKASQVLGGWRLINCTMYVTLEPCAMCAGALVNARIDRLVIGTMDEKRGFCGSVEDLTSHPKLNHKIEVTKGVLEDECKKLLVDFFKDLRKNKK
jgi:tRNA(adenine34) deaminase